jgi:hypothetical protein
MTAQLDFNLGARRRDRGHADALSRYTVQLIRFELVNVIRDSRNFTGTTDDMLDRLTPQTRDSLATNPNALGAIVRSLAKANLIRRTGQMVRSRRPEARQRMIAVWTVP